MQKQEQDLCLAPASPWWNLGAEWAPPGVRDGGSAKTHPKPHPGVVGDHLGGDRAQLAAFLWWIITKLPAFNCGKWVVSLRRTAEKLQPGKGRQKRLSSY